MVVKLAIKLSMALNLARLHHHTLILRSLWCVSISRYIMTKWLYSLFDMSFYPTTIIMQCCSTALNTHNKRSSNARYCQLSCWHFTNERIYLYIIWLALSYQTNDHLLSGNYLWEYKIHTVHAIVSWPNSRQWQMGHTSDLMMIVR